MWVTFIAGFLGLAYLFALGFLYRWRIDRRKERLPTNDKLLRGPAESLRKRLADLDDQLSHNMLLLACLPVAFAIGLGGTAKYSSVGLHFLALAPSAVLGLGVLIWQSKKVVSILNRRRDTYLGLYGERIVSENLDNLKAGGCRVFHDVPGEPGKDGKTTFNIDHVVVAPTGIFAIETKTRRKGRARPGFAEHEIIFDGKQLSFPWGEDRYGIDQAQRQADWLQKWLKTLIGRELPVQPVLTFPGWMVIERAKGPVRVLNPKVIPALVGARRNEPPVIDAATLDLVARQLDARCRDVEY